MHNQVIVKYPEIGVILMEGSRKEGSECTLFLCRTYLLEESFILIIFVVVTIKPKKDSNIQDRKKEIKMK